ncbi:RNase adapter RapZ [Acidovorax sp. CCYZU-2555]|uniref:RNase adapter RapZ n=1 Tax=Acidovorax sp. CCYZU-2555 TaxID=2835042 RepID=UPI001BCD5C8A|nr:RNase adapter RapZ [Acidovorax sp. CCYZU-2555]MBS7779497.1 RNase adapter RapZ [Acidovorax sp. CCYZU-2555]
MSLEIVLVTGMSGSGKSVALHALEDAGYYCVDNLPPELLASFVGLEHAHHGNRVAIAIDARSATGLPQLPAQLALLRSQGAVVQSLFLDATTGTLVRRFSETRRRHPLSGDELQHGRRALVQTIEWERELLADLREQSQVIDTSTIRPSQLQSYVKSLVTLPQGQMTLVFQSFGFKYGLPTDCDYLFDVRMLPNPYYDTELRPFSGKDATVQAFLRQQPEVQQMQQQIAQFFEHWLPLLEQNHRSYVTVAIGCTGGQHRSVYLVEQLAAHFGKDWPTLTRHRELDARTVAAEI